LTLIIHIALSYDRPSRDMLLSLPRTFSKFSLAFQCQVDDAGWLVNNALSGSA